MANSKLHELAGTRILTDVGVVAGGALITIYDADTTDEQTLYSDSELSTATTNPIVCDDVGLVPYFYVGTTAYKTRVTQGDTTLIYEQDDIPGATDLDSLSTDFSKPSTAVSVQSGDYTATSSDLGTIIQMDTSGGNYTVTMPSAVTAGNGKGLTLSHTGSQNIATMTTVSGQLILRKGGSTTSISLYKFGDSATVVSNGAAWVMQSDVNEIPTGILEPFLGTTAPGGYVLASGDTIGNAASGATERAHADTVALYTLIYDSFADAQCAVSTGRGANAAADYAANKTIALPDLRGRSFFGLDDIGGSASSRLGNVITSETVNGFSGGSEQHTLITSEHASHTHGPGTLSGSTNTTGNHNHQYGNSGQGVPNDGAGSEIFDAENGSSFTTDSAGSHSHTVSLGSGASASSGSDSAHSNMPPAWLGNWVIKL